jgi:hypothetical protein
MNKQLLRRNTASTEAGLSVVAVVCLLFFASASHAQNGDDWQSWPMGDRFTIALNAFFPGIKSSVRLDASDGTRGTEISFEQNLGMSDTEALPDLGFAWRFAKKHRLVFDVFELDRSGSAITTSEIRFGDEVFQATLPISSFFDTRVTSIGYSYSLIFDEKKELALSAGLSVQDIQFGLMGTAGGGIIEQDTGLTAPLPAFGLSGGYAFTDKWILHGGLGVFAFSIALSDEEELSGEVINAMIALQHNTFENVHFRLTYTYFDVKAEFTNDRRLSAVDYQYHGPMLSFIYAF